MPRSLLALISLVFFVLAAPAQAAVTITFYSHDMELIGDGLVTYYPHGFVLLSGSDANGRPVQDNYGFSAKNFYPNVLWQSVEGTLDEEPLPDGYVGRSDRHFSFVLSAEQYGAVMAVVEKWRNWPQPSYNIDSHNCVHFVKEIAQAAGLAVSDDKKFNREPGDFLDDVALRNKVFLAQFGIAPSATTAQAPPVTGASGDGEALQQRLKQLQDDVSAARAN